MDEVRARGFDLVVPAAVPDSLRLQLVVLVAADPTAAASEVRLYYGPFAIDESTRLPDIYEALGFAITERPARGVDAAFVQSEVGDRATIVDVGPYEAALIWADPFFEGSRRTYNLIWSDGQRDMTLAAGFDTPEQTVDLARSIYCSS